MTVAIVSTGGTIAAGSDPGEDGRSLSARDLIDAVPALSEITPIQTRDFASIPSSDFRVPQVYELVTVLAELDTDPAVEGIVVTQGTDVLEETAYFAALTFDGTTPVTFTGAMRKPIDAGSDGPANLLASVRTVLDDRAAGGVYVTFNDRIHAPRSVIKTHSMATDAFQSPEFGPLGFIEEDRVVWRREAIPPRDPMDPDPSTLTNDVYAVTVTVDMPPGQLRAAMDAEALCLATTGAGHVPSTAIPVLEQLRDAGVPIVVTTRCHAGRLAHGMYEFEGGELTLQSLGVYYSDRTLQQTRIETIVALGANCLDDRFHQPGME